MCQDYQHQLHYYCTLYMYSCLCIYSLVSVLIVASLVPSPLLAFCVEGAGHEASQTVLKYHRSKTPLISLLIAASCIRASQILHFIYVSI